MVSVVEFIMNLDGVTGRVVRKEEFNSWRKAWEYYEDDCLYDRRCPLTRIRRFGRNDGLIQHLDFGRDDPECRCRELVEERLGIDGPEE